jgi:hypothetical protein
MVVGDRSSEHRHVRTAQADHLMINPSVAHVLTLLRPNGGSLTNSALGWNPPGDRGAALRLPWGWPVDDPLQPVQDGPTSAPAPRYPPRFAARQAAALGRTCKPPPPVFEPRHDGYGVRSHGGRPSCATRTPGVFGRMVGHVSTRSGVVVLSGGVRRSASGSSLSALAGALNASPTGTSRDSARSPPRSMVTTMRSGDPPPRTMIRPRPVSLKRCAGDKIHCEYRGLEQRIGLGWYSGRSACA